LPRPQSIASLPWRLFIQTGQDGPDDVHPDGNGPLVDVSKPIELKEMSLVCMVADPTPTEELKRISFSPAAGV
jgi:hypothetical protein